MDNVTSPLVPGAKIRFLDKFQSTKLINDWKTSFNIDISNELIGIQKISLYRCELSQLDFFTPFSAAGSERLYQDLNNFDWFYIEEKWEFEEAIKDLLGCKKILEVGCGPGYFLGKATKKLKGSIIKGIELSETTLKRASKKNLSIERVDISEIVSRKEFFDAVCAFQVLEHVNQPRDFLEAMIQTLVPGGKLILCVPNKASFLRHQYNLLDMPPHHMTRWNARTLKFLEKIFPLRLSRIRFEPLAKYHVKGYLLAYAKYWQGKLAVEQDFLSDSNLFHVEDKLVKSGLYRFLRGQSLYAMFEKL